MAKFHVNPETGNASACSAAKDRCPFGGADEHYTSKEAAVKGFENSQKGSFNAPVKTQAKQAKDNIEFLAERSLNETELYNAAAKERSFSKFFMKGYSEATSTEARVEFFEKYNGLRDIHMKNVNNEVYKTILAYEKDPNTTWEASLYHFKIDPLSKEQISRLDKSENFQAIHNLALAHIRHKKHFAQLPLKYLSTIGGIKGTAIGGLADVAAAVHHNHPSWSPDDETFSELNPALTTAERPVAGHRRVVGAPASLQHVNSSAEKLLGRYVLDKYGVEKAEDFWNEVKASQKSANRPLMSNFIAVENRIRRERGQMILGSLRG